MFKFGCGDCGEFWYVGNPRTCKCPHKEPIKEWVGLTDEDEIDWEEGGNLKDLIKAIEAKLKEKNDR